MNDEFRYQEHENVLVGPERRPLNSARNYGAGSIHDDKTAKKLGFRGGTVAGSLHMEQFPPMLTAALGEEWSNTGGMSLYFKRATTDSEPVRVFAEKLTPGHQQVKTWMEDSDGNLIAEGTANIGNSDPESMLRTRVSTSPAAQELRMLASLSVGDTSPRIAAEVPASALDARLKVITEMLPIYTDESVSGERAMTPALQVYLLSQAGALLFPKNGDLGVGLYGAIELQQYCGPVFVDHRYEVQATILALGETPKTEYVYYESRLFEPGSDDCVLSMIMMNRFMKQSSKLWKEK